MVFKLIIDESIAKALRVKRAKLDLSKNELALKLGMSNKTYSRLERGNWLARKTIATKVLNWLAEDYE